MGKKRIAVIGGGAAGMMAAVTAARAGADVTIYEGNDRLGKKILATGNGKCNLGNTVLSADCYHGADAEWIQACLDRFGTEETMTFFREIGLFVKEKNGYLYPVSEQAASVLDVLRNEVTALGITVKTGCKVTEIKRERGICVLWEQGRQNYDSVIIACGSKAAPKSGSDGSGYRLARQIGHRIVPVVPALVQLKCREAYCKAVAGVRAEAQISVCTEERVLAVESGELQLTEYGISGIPVFQLSRTVNYALEGKKKLTVHIDFLPRLTEEELLKAAKERFYKLKNRNLEEFFTGVLHKKLMMQFLKLSGLKPGGMMGETSFSQIEKVFLLCKDYTLHITGSNSFEQAQICAGGVETKELTAGMESKKMPGIYFAGEILDVDGRCGGYNLQWAWTSGYLAGLGAAGHGNR